MNKFFKDESGTSTIISGDKLVTEKLSIIKDILKVVKHLSKTEISKAKSLIDELIRKNKDPSITEILNDLMDIINSYSIPLYGNN